MTTASFTCQVARGAASRAATDFTKPKPSFPDAQFEIQQIVAEGGMSSAQLALTGTHIALLGEIPARAIS